MHPKRERLSGPGNDFVSTRLKIEDLRAANRPYSEIRDTIPPLLEELAGGCRNYRSDASSYGDPAGLFDILADFIDDLAHRAHAGIQGEIGARVAYHAAMTSRGLLNGGMMPSELEGPPGPAGPLSARAGRQPWHEGRGPRGGAA